MPTKGQGNNFLATVILMVGVIFALSLISLILGTAGWELHAWLRLKIIAGTMFLLLFKLLLIILTLGSMAVFTLYLWKSLLKESEKKEHQLATQPDNTLVETENVAENVAKDEGAVTVSQVIELEDKSNPVNEQIPQEDFEHKPKSKKKRAASREPKNKSKDSPQNKGGVKE